MLFLRCNFVSGLLCKLKPRKPSKTLNLFVKTYVVFSALTVIATSTWSMHYNRLGIINQPAYIGPRTGAVFMTAPNTIYLDYGGQTTDWTQTNVSDCLSGSV